MHGLFVASGGRNSPKSASSDFIAQIYSKLETDFCDLFLGRSPYMGHHPRSWHWGEGRGGWVSGWGGCVGGGEREKKACRCVCVFIFQLMCRESVFGFMCVWRGRWRPPRLLSGVPGICARARAEPPGRAAAEPLSKKIGAGPAITFQRCRAAGACAGGSPGARKMRASAVYTYACIHTCTYINIHVYIWT